MTRVSERSRNPSNALRLLRKVLATGWFAPDAIARALVVSDGTLWTYLDEATPMPLDRQLCLARFVIECLPPLARAGHQLRAQVGAAMAYHNGETETHQHLPPSRVWSRG